MSKTSIYYEQKAPKQRSEVHKKYTTTRSKAKTRGEGPRKNYASLKKNPPNPQNLKSKKDQNLKTT